jgi:hypothetical protein
MNTNLTLRALDSINLCLAHELTVAHDAVLVLLAINIGNAWEAGDAQLVLELCRQVEALGLTKVNAVLAAIWKCPACAKLTAGGDKCVQCKNTKPRGHA